MSDLNPTNDLCALCGKVAEGHAYADDVRLCHGDETPSCYEQWSWGWRPRAVPVSVDEARRLLNRGWA